MSESSSGAQSRAVVCDIVVLTLDQPEVLKACVESVLEHTQIPCRLIIVNNGGGPRIQEYCRSLKPTPCVSFVFHDFASNRGFVRGNNLAVRGGNSPYVCLLNNDCVVTPGWLERLIRLAELNPSFAAINPQCNTMMEPEEVKGLSIAERAKHYRQFEGKFMILGSVVGYCMLIRRSVINEFGLFDEGIDTAYFEDTDFSFRIKQAGYKCALACNAYVHHLPFGQSESISMKRRRMLIAKNKAWFEKKWGTSLRLAMVYHLRTGDTDSLRWIFDVARDLGLNDNHPHLILGLGGTAYKNEEDILSAFRVDRLASPNLRFILYRFPAFRLTAFLRLACKWRKGYHVVASDDLSFLRWASLLKPFFRFWVAYLELPSSWNASAAWQKIPPFLDRVYLSKPDHLKRLQDLCRDSGSCRVLLRDRLRGIRADKKESSCVK